MESKVKWVVGPTEDVVQALMEKLVYPCLSRSSMLSSTHPPSYAEHKAVATQMHAVVLLYNYYHRKQKLDLKFLDLASFCNLAVVLKPSLAAFIDVTRDNKLWKLNAAECQFSLTEKAIKNACDIAAALDASLEDPTTEGWPISKVAVLLIDSKKENCKLQFGAVTEGVWSMFEKELDGSPINLEKSCGGKSGDKRKRDNLKAAGNEILQICCDVVREITGTESNELVVLGSDVAYSLNEEKSTTQFYLVQLPGNGTISLKEQVPLKCLVEKLVGPLAEKAFGTWSATEVVSYYHMLPYLGFISRWLSGKDLCSPTIYAASFAQNTIKSCSKDHTQSRISNPSVSTNTVKDSEHTDKDISRKTTKSSDETPDKNNSNEYHRKSKPSSDPDSSVAVNMVKNSNQRPNTAKKNSSSRTYLERLVKDINDRENSKNSVKDDDVVWKRSTKPHVSPVSSTEEVADNDQHKVFESKGYSPKNVATDIGEMKKLPNKCEINTISEPENEERRIESPKVLDKKEIENCQNEGSVFCPSPNSGQVTTPSEKPSSGVGSYYQRRQHGLSSSAHIDNDHDAHDGTTWNVDLADNLKNSKNTGCRDGKVSDQIRNAFAANTKKPADYDQLCQTEGTNKLTSEVALENELASSEESQKALALLCTKREQLFSQVSCKDTLAQYENCIERILDGGKAGSARRCIQSILRGNNHWMLKNETVMQDKDHNSKSLTEKQSSSSSISGIIVPGKSKSEDLEYMCPTNNWRQPRYLVEPLEGDKKKKVLTYNDLCAKMDKKQKTSLSKALVAVPNVEIGEASASAEALKIVLGQGAHLQLESSAIRGGGDLLLDDEVCQMGTIEASAYALPLIVKLLNAMISINQNATTSEEKESLKFAYQDVLKDNENLKASLHEEQTKSKALKQQHEGMKGQLEVTKNQLEYEKVLLKMLRAEVEKIEARAVAQTRRDLMMDVINGDNANWVPVEQVKTCDEMLWQLDNGDSLEIAERMEEDEIIV